MKEDKPKLKKVSPAFRLKLAEIIKYCLAMGVTSNHEIIARAKLLHPKIEINEQEIVTTKQIYQLDGYRY